jgi:enamine deaminase RidA (YjgF/YER057c/UK114 family)
MSVESEIGKISRNVIMASADAAVANLVQFLKSEGMDDDKIIRATSIVKSTIESVGFNGVNQYISLFNEIGKSTNRK